MEDTHRRKPDISGLRQTQKAVTKGLAAQVFLARDANPALTAPLAELCKRMDVPLDQSLTMAQLGQACRIDVGCAAAAMRKPH